MEKIKELRDRTGAGMVDCKKALDEAGGDIDKAVEVLRKKGISKAAKRSEREASEGIVEVTVNSDNTKGYILELKSETDFVARNEDFKSLAKDILKLVEESDLKDREEVLQASKDGLSVDDSIKNLSGVIGEKIDLGRVAALKGETVSAYSHLGGKIAVLVALDQSSKKDLADDIAMHIAAANPRYLESSEIPVEEIEKEKSVYREQLLKEGKPENIIDNIIEGKIKKYYSEVCLLNQEYVKDDKKSIQDILGDVKVLAFVRFSL
jgi:elongation factor Ts